ncbi:MAG TPA: IS5 family transposase [Thermoanaerobaculia bacterium]|nr:IS5 family transposase [Thermoanaerobaculia bacterium]
MRGSDRRSGALFSYVDLEKRVPTGHPLRVIRCIANDALEAMSGAFDALYASVGRPSIPPEMLLRALLLQAFYGVRSERQLMERLEFDLLFRWFAGLGVDDPVWDASTFSKNRDRLLEGDAAAAFLAAIVAHPKVRRLVSTEHFSVDGTLIEAWASMKSFRPKAEGEDPPDDGAPPPGAGRNAEVDFRGERRTNGRHWSAIGPSDNGDHASTTDPDARLFRKSRGTGAVLCFMGHALMENRSGLVVDAELTRATGTAERVAALAMLEGVARDTGRRVTIGADKGYDAAEFVMEVRELNAVPHVAQNTAGRRSAIDGRTTRHPGYAASQRIRKRIEEVFGWTKSSAGHRKTRFRGLPRVRFAFTLATAAYNLIRLPKLIAA